MDTHVIELTADQIEAIARAEYERIGGDSYEPSRKRSTPKPCPRGNDPKGDLRCSGVTVEGVRVVDPHDAPATDFGHNGRDCRKGKTRCRRNECRRCVGVRNNVRHALNRARREGMTDAEIRAAKPEKRCPSCATVKPSGEFRVARANADGLDSKCSPCAYEISKRTWLPENKRAANQRRRARLRAVVVEQFTTRDLLASWDENAFYECFWCGLNFDDNNPMHVDHVIPLSSGGAHAVTNLVPSCRSCNIRKGDRDPWEWFQIIASERGFMAA